MTGVNLVLASITQLQSSVRIIFLMISPLAALPSFFNPEKSQISDFALAKQFSLCWTSSMSLIPLTLMGCVYLPALETKSKLLAAVQSFPVLHSGRTRNKAKTDKCK